MFLLLLGCVYTIRILWAIKVDLFIDEGFQGLLIQHGWTDIIHIMTADYNTFLHPIYLKAWTVIFGDSHISIRLSSLLISAFSLYVFYKITAFFWENTQTRKWASLIYALLPSVMYYSYEVRYYGMENLWVLCAVYYILKARVSEVDRRDVLCFGGVLTAGLYTHVLFAIPAALLGLYILITSYKNKSLRKYIASFAMVLVLFSYWLPYLFEQLHSKQEGGWLFFNYWKTVLFDQMRLWFYPFMHNTGTVLWFSLATLLSLLAIIGLSLSYKKGHTMLILYMLLGTHTAFFFISASVLPIYYFRYFSFIMAFYAIGLVSFLHVILQKEQRLRIVLIAIAVILFGVQVIPRNFNLNLRDVQPYIETYARNGYVILFDSPFTYMPGAFYSNGKDFPVYLWADEKTFPRYFGKVIIPIEAYIPALDSSQKYLVIQNRYGPPHQPPKNISDQMIYIDRIRLWTIEAK